MSDVVSFEFANALKGAGYPQEKSEKGWLKLDNEYHLKPMDGIIMSCNYNISSDYCAAPSIGELLHKLPSGIGSLDEENYYTLVCGRDLAFWYVAYQHIEHGKGNIQISKSIDLAECLAETWIWLKKNNHLGGKE